MSYSVYDGNIKQTGEGHASISERHLDSDVLKVNRPEEGMLSEE